MIFSSRRPRQKTRFLENLRFSIAVNGDDILEPEHPAMCWLAPEMATAIYTYGDTILPVKPI